MSMYYMPRISAERHEAGTRPLIFGRVFLPTLEVSRNDFAGAAKAADLQHMPLTSLLAIGISMPG